MKKITKDLLNKKYFIFDLDGTLIDSMGMWNLIDQQIILRHTGRKAELMKIKSFRDSIIYDKRVQGNVYLAYYKELIKHFNLGISVEQFRQERRVLYKEIATNKLEYKQGASEFLKFLKRKGKKIAIATTTTKDTYDIYTQDNKNLVRQAPLSKIADVAVLYEDAEKKKPDPEAYLLVMKKFGCKAQDCIVFEDSFNGIRSAKGAGLEVVAVYDEFAQDEQEHIDKLADYKIDSFSDLLDLFGENEIDREIE